MNPKFHHKTEVSAALSLRPSVPDHELITLIGGGSYGQIWLARNVVGVYRAVKVVTRASFQSDRPYQREFEGVQRFEPISRSHEGFLQILHIGRNEAAGFFYYVMELADSQNPEWREYPERYLPATLSNELDRAGALSLDLCVDVALALSSALIRLHAQGLVHRDLKPANVVFVGGKPKLADVGLVTEAGVGTTVVGTEGYVPREGPGQPAADVYALGRMLYELSTGIPCTEFPKLPEQLPVSSTGISFADFNEVMCRCCEEDVTRRYQKAEEVFWHFSLLKRGTSLKRLLLFDRVWRQGRRYALVGLLLFVFLGVALYQGWKSNLRDHELLQRTIGRFIALGNQSMGDGKGISDPSWALPSFVSALALSEGDSDAEDAQRVRVASALDRAPALQQIWFSGPSRTARSAGFGVRADEVLVPVEGGFFQVMRVRDGQAVSKRVGTGRGDEMGVLSRDGRKVLTSSRSELMVRIWDLEGGLGAREIPVEHYVSHADWSPDGERVILASSVGTGVSATSIHLKSGHVVRFYGHTGPVQHAVFSPDGFWVATSGRDSWVHLHEAATGKLMGSLDHHRNWVNWSAFSPDGSLLATANFDRTVQIWRVEDLKEVTKVPLEHSGGVRVVEFSPDGRTLLAGTFDFTVQFWDVRTGQPTWVPLHHAEHVITAHFSPEGREVLTLTQDGISRLWKLPGDKPWGTGRGTITAMSRDGSHWLEREGAEWKSVREGGGSGSGSGGFVLSPPFEGGRWTQVTVSPDGRRWGLLADAAGDQETELQKVAVANCESGQWAEMGRWRGVKDVQCAAVDDACIISGTDYLKCWDIGRNALRWEHPLEGWSRTVLGAGGRHVAIVSNQKDQSVLKIYSLRTGQLLCGVTNPPPFQVRDVDFSPDDRLVAMALQTSLAQSSAAWLIRVLDGQRLHPPLQHRDGVSSVRFSNKGSRVATSGEDQRAIVWDVETGAQLTRPMEHLDQVSSVRWSSDDRWLATFCENGQVRVWDALTGDPISPSLRVDDRATEVAFVGGRRGLMTWAGRGGGAGLYLELRRETVDVEDLKVWAALISGQEDYGGSAGRWVTESQEQGWDRMRKGGYPKRWGRGLGGY